MNPTRPQRAIIFVASNRGNRILGALQETGWPVDYIVCHIASKMAQAHTLWRLLNKLRGQPKPLLLLVDFFGFFPIAMLQLAHWCGVTTALRVRGDFWNEQSALYKATRSPLKRLFYRIKIWSGSILAAQATYVLPVSDSLRQAVIEKAHSRELDKVITVPIFVQGERIGLNDEITCNVSRRAFGITDDSILLLTVTALKYHAKARALLDFAEVFTKLGEEYPNLYWVIAGDGENRRWIEETIHRSNPWAARINFVGHVTPVASLYRTADLFVYYSYADGLPNTLLEAGLCKVATVVNDYEPLAEFIQDGKTGIVVPSDDPEVASALIADLLASPQRRATLAANAYQNVVENYSAAAVGKQLNHILRDIATQDAPARTHQAS